ncbi:hypothetical protein [Brevibacterium album]|uniref:hypothetical protein n=1 Tax=Brevibacterium album TaxID=417948 RepID=UPI0004019609|nr:hypothetical protein [Brevibacterium album]
MKHRITRCRSAAAALSACLLLTACSAPAEEPSSTDPAAPQEQPAGSGADDTLAQLIDKGLEQVQSDFQREVLQKAKETGEVSEADWKEANNRLAQCAKDGGLEIELMYQGAEVQYISPAGTDSTEETRAKENELILECEMKTNAFIKDAYAYLNGSQGPGEDYALERAVLACLIDKELVPEGTTLEQFLASMNNDDATSRTDESSTEGNEEYDACWRENI